MSGQERNQGGLSTTLCLFSRLYCKKELSDPIQKNRRDSAVYSQPAHNTYLLQLVAEDSPDIPEILLIYPSNTVVSRDTGKYSMNLTIVIYRCSSLI